MSAPIPIAAQNVKKGRGRPKKAAPAPAVTAEQLQPGLDLLVCLGTSILTHFMTRTIPDEAKRETLRDILPIRRGEESAAISAPAARIVEKSWLNRIIGPAIAGAEDYTLLTTGVMAYLERVKAEVKAALDEPTATVGSVGAVPSTNAA